MLHVILFSLSAITSTVPKELQGSYADALGSCEAGKSIYIRENSIEWSGRTDRVIFAERLTPSSAHLFIEKPNAGRGSVELHFEIQGDRSEHMIVIDHLSDAEDIVARGTPIPDKSVMGFYQRCESGKH